MGYLRCSKVRCAAGHTDYKDVAKQVSAYVIDTKANLVERLAEGIATLLREQFEVAWCKVRINKRGAVTGARDVGVEIERGQP